MLRAFGVLSNPGVLPFIDRNALAKVRPNESCLAFLDLKVLEFLKDRGSLSAVTPIESIYYFAGGSLHAAKKSLLDLQSWGWVTVDEFFQTVFLTEWGRLVAHFPELKEALRGLDVPDPTLTTFHLDTLRSVPASTEHREAGFNIPFIAQCPPSDSIEDTISRLDDLLFLGLVEAAPSSTHAIPVFRRTPAGDAALRSTLPQDASKPVPPVTTTPAPEKPASVSLVQRVRNLEGEVESIKHTLNAPIRCVEAAPTLRKCADENKADRVAFIENLHSRVVYFLVNGWGGGRFSLKRHPWPNYTAPAGIVTKELSTSLSELVDVADLPGSLVRLYRDNGKVFVWHSYLTDSHVACHEFAKTLVDHFTAGILAEPGVSDWWVSLSGIADEFKVSEDFVTKAIAASQGKLKLSDSCMVSLTNPPGNPEPKAPKPTFTRTALTDLGRTLIRWAGGVLGPFTLAQAALAHPQYSEATLNLTITGLVDAGLLCKTSTGAPTYKRTVRGCYEAQFETNEPKAAEVKPVKTITLKERALAFLSEDKQGRIWYSTTVLAIALDCKTATLFEVLEKVARHDKSVLCRPYLDYTLWASREVQLAASLETRPVRCAIAEFLRRNAPHGYTPSQIAAGTGYHLSTVNRALACRGRDHVIVENDGKYSIPAPPKAS